MWARGMAVTCIFACAIAMEANAVSDFQWTFGDIGTSAYVLTAVSSAQVYGGAIGANNPALTLIVGKRYAVTVQNSATHPFEVIAKGNSDTSDVVLLGMGTAVGTLESDPGIAWIDDEQPVLGTVTFTMTTELAAAMRAVGLTSGYRCGVHSATMRGNFTLLGEPLADPIAARIAKGAVAVELQTVATGFTSPLGAVFPNDGTGRMLVYDQKGTVTVIQGGTALATPLLDVSSRLVTLNPGYDERGLLGFALHPNFSANHKVYTYTSEPLAGAADFTVPLASGFHDHQSVVAEWQIGSDPNRIDTATRREILRIDEPQSNHNGGALHFGPDGYLYIALGDGGNADDEGNGHSASGNGQDLTNVLGKILRIDVDGGGAPSANGKYGIPAANPFVGMTGIDEIFAYGLRNPYAISFDTGTGTLYVGDVGQNKVEEVDTVVAGGNYGWRVKEGGFFFNSYGTESGFVSNTSVVPPVPAGLVDPIAQYDHDDGTAVIGGYVYRGTKIPELAGRYVLGDLGTSFSTPSGRLFYLNAYNQLQELKIGRTDRPVGLWIKGFAQDLSGEIYVLGTAQLGPTGTSGVVQKLVPVFQDSDTDHLPDSVETNTGIYVSPTNTGTDPDNADTDGDGVSDGLEVTFGTNPVDPSSTPQLPVQGAFGLTALAVALGYLGFRRLRRAQNGSVRSSL